MCVCATISAHIERLNVSYMQYFFFTAIPPSCVMSRLNWDKQTRRLFSLNWPQGGWFSPQAAMSMCCVMSPHCNFFYVTGIKPSCQRGFFSSLKKYWYWNSGQVRWVTSSSISSPYDWPELLKAVTMRPHGRAKVFRDCARFGFLNAKMNNLPLFHLFWVSFNFLCWFLCHLVCAKLLNGNIGRAKKFAFRKVCDWPISLNSKTQAWTLSYG